MAGFFPPAITLFICDETTALPTFAAVPVALSMTVEIPGTLGTFGTLGTLGTLVTLGILGVLGKFDMFCTRSAVSDTGMATLPVERIAQGAAVTSAIAAAALATSGADAALIIAAVSIAPVTPVSSAATPVIFAAVAVAAVAVAPLNNPAAPAPASASKGIAPVPKEETKLVMPEKNPLLPVCEMTKSFHAFTAAGIFAGSSRAMVFIFSAIAI